MVAWEIIVFLQPACGWLSSPARPSRAPCAPARSLQPPKHSRHPQTPQREQLTIPPEEAVKPWTGDLAGMIKRGRIRVLTVYSKTFYFVNQGLQRGATYDFVRAFEEELNKRLAKEKKLKYKHLKVQVVFMPVARDDLLPALAAGKGDIAAANLTRTAERQQLVDFSSPVYANVSELVVSGPTSPAGVQCGGPGGAGGLRPQVLQLL